MSETPDILVLRPLSEAKKYDALVSAAEHVCWFDWSGNDSDAVAAIEELRRLVGGKPE